MNYIQKYLKHHNIGEQDIVRCDVCGRLGSEIHHIKFKSAMGGDEIENLILLCRLCHESAHFIRKPYLKAEELHDIKNKTS